MNPAVFALKKRTLMVVLSVFLIIAGLNSYFELGRLEDPTFTIKTALVITPYPGASPKQVEEEVTDVIEEAIQSMGQVKEIYSTSKEGISFVFVDMKDTYKSAELPQIWDELRRKVGDARAELPPGAGPPIVNDDFGDVYGVFFAITGKGYSYAQLKDYADDLKRDLLLCQDVAKIDFWGLQREIIYVEINRARIAELGISLEEIYGTLAAQNLVQKSGSVDVNTEYMRITPTGEFVSEDFIRDLYIGGEDGLVRLGDVAEVKRGYQEPPRNLMRFNGDVCIGMGISTIDGGNVITMGDAIKSKLEELQELKPEGIEINTIYYQSDDVTVAVNVFVMNLIQAVVIVVALLMLFMGWQSGLLIGFILILNILATFLGMQVAGIVLQKISLGALILALGMLVDNAIVVADGILVRVERGENREQAAEEVVRDSRWPLLGATFIAILAFTAIGFSPGNVGEFCRSLFDVMAMSLLISWILAVTVTPLLCVWFLKIPDIEGFDPYDKPMYRRYKRLLAFVLNHKGLTVIVTAVLLFLSMGVFKAVPKSFFPDSTKGFFYISYWKPQGTHIDHTAEDLDEISKYVSQLEGVTDVTSFIGEGALRFILSYDYENPNSSYGQLIVNVDDYRRIDDLMVKVDDYLRENYPDSEPLSFKNKNGPGVTYKVEVRLRGPDESVLLGLSEKVKKIMRDCGNARDIRTDWRHPVRVIRPDFSEAQARRAGVSRSDLSNALQWNFDGLISGVYREGDELLPIVFRAPDEERDSVENIDNVQVWSSLKRTFVPIGQVVTDVKTEWENPLIQRRDRQRTVTVQCNPIVGFADPLRQSILDEVEALQLPAGYSMEWGGEYNDSTEAQESLGKIFPVCIIGMFIILVFLFNSIRRPLIIFSVLPLSLIGVANGLMLLKMPFGFMSILGFLGLSGMLIKNAIVLIDQIELDLASGVEPYLAVVNSAVSRLRPVMMAAGTTILGMAPLVSDPLYASMAATIMSGLFVGTFLTLFIVPVLYSLFFRIQPVKKEV